MASTKSNPALDGAGTLFDRLIDAWNRRDANAFAGCFAPNGSMVGFDGTQIDGREAIEQHIGAVFGSHQTARFVTIVREVRDLAPTVVLLRANAGMVPPGKDDINPATNAAQSLVGVHEGANWRVALFQNTPSALHGRPEDAARLTEELRNAMRGQGRH